MLAAVFSVLALCASGVLADHVAAVRSLSIRGISDSLSLINARDCGHPAVDLYQLGIKCVSLIRVDYCVSLSPFYKLLPLFSFSAVWRRWESSHSQSIPKVRILIACRIPSPCHDEFFSFCSIVVGVSAYGRSIDLQPINICNQTACPLELTKDFSGMSIRNWASVLDRS